MTLPQIRMSDFLSGIKEVYVYMEFFVRREGDEKASSGFIAFGLVRKMFAAVLERRLKSFFRVFSKTMEKIKSREVPDGF